MKKRSNSHRRGYCKSFKIARCLSCQECSKSQSSKTDFQPQFNRVIAKNKGKKNKKKKNSKQTKKKPKKRRNLDQEGLSDHIVYCIVNTDYFQTRGSMIAEVAKSFLNLYMNADRDRIKSKALDNWEESGERILVLKGCNHKHLRYLAEEVFAAATEIHCLYKSWGKSKIMLVLSVLGKQVDLIDTLETLSALR